MTADRISAFYRQVESIWPPDTDVYPLLKESNATLRALYTGDARPELLAQNVFRFSLYSDEILIVDPFMLPWMMRDKYSPIKHPTKYRADTLKLAFLTLALEPWIRTEMVRFIPDPTDFDLKLKSQFLETAKRRVDSLGESRHQDEHEDFERLEPIFKMDYMRTHYSLPRDRMEKQFLQGGVRPDQLQGLVEYAIKQRNADPLALEEESLDAGQMLIMRSGGNLETTLLIAEATGAFPYCDMVTRWHELLTAADDLNEVSQLWTPLTKAFSELPFRFLNNVDPTFAYRMREEQRLGSLRTFLRRLWNDMSTSPDAASMERKSKVFAEELQSEYQSAKADWIGIDRDYQNATRKAAWTAGLAGGGGALATGFLTVALSALGFAVAAKYDSLRRNQRFEEFRKKVPMSVFIDLAAGQRIKSPF